MGDFTLVVFGNQLKFEMRTCNTFDCNSLPVRSHKHCEHCLRELLGGGE